MPDCPRCFAPAVPIAGTCARCGYRMERAYPARVCGCVACRASMRSGYTRCPKCRAWQPGGHIVRIPLPGEGAIELVLGEG